MGVLISVCLFGSTVLLSGLGKERNDRVRGNQSISKEASQNRVHQNNGFVFELKQADSDLETMEPNARGAEEVPWLTIPL